MPRLSKDQREEVQKMLETGMSQKKIAEKMKTASSTIQRLVVRFNETGSVEDRPRPGRPRTMPKVNHLWLECSGEERPFVCMECGKTFIKFHSLKGHIKIHSKVCEFQCEHCGKEYNFKSSFDRHLKCHTGEKPFVCEYCARAFADLSTMKTHIRTHTGERPHKCHLCSHACSTAGNLHAHMRVHRDKVGGEIPKPKVNPPRSKMIPVFSKEELLERAKKKWTGKGKIMSWQEVTKLSQEFVQQIANTDFDESRVSIDGQDAPEESETPLNLSIKQEPEDCSRVDTVSAGSSELEGVTRTEESIGAYTSVLDDNRDSDARPIPNISLQFDQELVTKVETDI